jgi:hypothetical protein
LNLKNRISEYRHSIHITGSGHGKPPASSLDERVAGIIGEKLLSGIVSEDEGETTAGKRDGEAVLKPIPFIINEKGDQN